MKKLFFLFLFFLFLNAQDKYSDLYNSTTWKALLHYHDGFKIKDKHFYISDKPTLKKEFYATLKAFKNNKYLCKFPARRLYLEKVLHIKFTEKECPDLNTYIDKVPIDNIYLVFASENIKDPSSMMGHTFFKFEGKRKDGYYASHAISFFTMINTVNPLKLIYENSVTGMNGYFVLRPYKEILYGYLINENRNVWEYKLNLNDYEKKMVFFHTWELKGIKQKYYFTSYNCATVIYDILATSRDLKKYKMWLTPLELTKIVYNDGMVESASLLPSDEWFIKLLEKELSINDIYDIKQAVLKRDYKAFDLPINNKNFYKTTLAKVYVNSLHDDKYKNFKKYLFQKKFPYVLDLSKYKNPVKTPPERDISLSYFSDDNNYLKVSFLPASHFLSDDNREYFNESQLKIGCFSLLINNKKILLDNFTIYNMYNLIPYDILTNSFSYNFNMSIQRDYDSNLHKQTFFKINAGLGYDFNVFHDVNIFALAEVEDRYHSKNSLLYYPKFGFMMYEILNSKLYAYYQPVFHSDDKIYDKISLTQTFYIKKNFHLFIKFNKIDSKKEFEVGIKKLF